MNRNVVWRCTYHVVWCPKDRRGVLVGPVETRLKALLRDIASELLREIEVMPDHVHILMDVDPQFSVQRVVRVMKGRTSRVLLSDSAHCVLVFQRSGLTHTSCPPLAGRRSTSSSSTSPIKSETICASGSHAPRWLLRRGVRHAWKWGAASISSTLDLRPPSAPSHPARVSSPPAPPCAEHSNTKRVSRA